jgi:hypothetical protein
MGSTSRRAVEGANEISRRALAKIGSLKMHSTGSVADRQPSFYLPSKQSGKTNVPYAIKIPDVVVVWLTRLAPAGLLARHANAAAG